MTGKNYKTDVKFKSSLVIGKFYPFHLGHQHLITTAAEHSTHVTVVVMGSVFQKYTVDQRVKWIEETFETYSNVTVLGIKDDVYDDYNDSTIWLHHVEIIRACLQAHNVPTVDAVFTSENYGTELAEHFQSEHFLVDLPRITFPISGTKMREDLYGRWEFLPTAVKQDLSTRIVVIGAESTGTTTLSKDLAESYSKDIALPSSFRNTDWIPEYGRDYTYLKLDEAKRINPNATMDDLVWTSEDFVKIGEKQTEWENNQVTKNNSSPLIICDTDALATTVWEQRYIGGGASGNRSYSDNLPVRDIYLITNHEGVEFEQDGIRDGEHIREAMTGEFIQLLTKRNLSWALITGDRSHRLKVATKIIDNILANKNTKF